MKSTPTPPNMIHEQQRELKQLQAREAKLIRADERAFRAANRRIDQIDNQCDAHYGRLQREAAKQYKTASKPLRAEQLALRKAVRRSEEQRTPAAREIKVIARRIAVLLGRLGS
jgi:hypothetical protein